MRVDIARRIIDIFIGAYWSQSAAMASRGDVLHLFRQALNSDTGGIRLRCATEDEAYQLRKRCYHVRDFEREEARLKLPDPRLGDHVPIFDIKGNFVGVTEFMRWRRKVETEFDCLMFRVIDRDLIVLRIAERVCEPPARTGALPAAQEMSRSDIEALPPACQLKPYRPGENPILGRKPEGILKGLGGRL